MVLEVPEKSRISSTGWRSRTPPAVVPGVPFQSTGHCVASVYSSIRYGSTGHGVAYGGVLPPTSKRPKVRGRIPGSNIRYLSTAFRIAPYAISVPHIA
eukprot:1677413-Rhodomonas_salina.1